MKFALVTAFVVITTFAASARDTLTTPSTRPISKIESRELPPEIVTDRIVRQLADILMATPAGRPGAKPVRPLEDIWYRTRPRATGAPDVGRSDRVIFEFLPVFGDA